MVRVVFALALAAVAVADVYMHYPRGSNNRLNEKSANRNNGNRLFDSQNNNRGGYNKGDFGTEAANANDGGQYSELYMESSKIGIEWTNQHGCGGNEKDLPHKLNCNMVIQYTCDTKNTADFFENVILSDGYNTNTPDAENTLADLDDQTTQNDNNDRGRMESEAWYYQCRHRNRNKGLFTADQKLKGDSSKYTRQNPNGNRNGLECPEERDYYPYWHPTNWVDIAYLTDTTTDCTEGFDVLGNSMNSNEVYKCVHNAFTNGQKNLNADENEVKKVMNAFNEADCTTEGGAWTAFSHDVAAPVCKQGDWSRVNHLGNGENGQANTYNWTIPQISQMSKYTKVDSGTAKCAVRLRYNISTDDYDPRNTNSSLNEDKNKGIISPVEQNPTINVNSLDLNGLRLAINTAQFGRTFQDRSHAFYIKQRPQGTLSTGNPTIVNLNVRGKRGNIVQTFPSVEYDFTPNRVHVTPNTLIHVQWTGSNTHNNGNPAGDGQAGDAGEGQGGTDRHNIADLTCIGCNYPMHYSSPYEGEGVKELGAKPEDTIKQLFKDGNFECYAPSKTLTKDNYWQGSLDLELLSEEDCALRMATSNFYKNPSDTGAGDLNPTLNNAAASLVGGVFLKATNKAIGTYHYMSTRNNNFSNRSQKGTIIVQSALTNNGIASTSA